MNSWYRHYLSGAVLGSALLAPAAMADTCSSDHSIQVTAERTELAEVIETIAARCDFDIVSSADLSPEVSIDYRNWSARETLRRLLRAYSYRLDTDLDGRPRTLRIFGHADQLRFVIHDPLLQIRVELTDADIDRRVDATLDLLEHGADRPHEVAVLLTMAANDADASVREAAAAVSDELALADQPRGSRR